MACSLIDDGLWPRCVESAAQERGPRSIRRRSKSARVGQNSRPVTINPFQPAGVDSASSVFLSSRSPLSWNEWCGLPSGSVTSSS